MKFKHVFMASILSTIIIVCGKLFWGETTTFVEHCLLNAVLIMFIKLHDNKS